LRNLQRVPSRGGPSVNRAPRSFLGVARGGMPPRGAHDRAGLGGPTKSPVEPSQYISPHRAPHVARKIAEQHFLSWQKQPGTNPPARSPRPTRDEQRGCRGIDSSGDGRSWRKTGTRSRDAGGTGGKQQAGKSSGPQGEGARETMRESYQGLLKKKPQFVHPYSGFCLVLIPRGSVAWGRVVDSMSHPDFWARRGASQWGAAENDFHGRWTKSVWPSAAGRDASFEAWSNRRRDHIFRHFRTGQKDQGRLFSARPGAIGAEVRRVSKTSPHSGAEGHGRFCRRAPPSFSETGPRDVHGARFAVPAFRGTGFFLFEKCTTRRARFCGPMRTQRTGGNSGWEGESGFPKPGRGPRAPNRPASFFHTLC